MQEENKIEDKIREMNIANFKLKGIDIQNEAKMEKQIKEMEVLTLVTNCTIGVAGLLSFAGMIALGYQSAKAEKTFPKAEIKMNEENLCLPQTIKRANLPVQIRIQFQERIKD
ncbi:MAG: hypothetical protein IKV03_00010 [Alphaproteobacteria bacterium]|nr:hypothetical protein [Alphaproteobacteria bacterium]